MSYAARFGESRLRPGLFTQAALRFQGSSTRTIGGVRRLSLPLLRQVASDFEAPPQNATPREETAGQGLPESQSPTKTGDPQTIL